MADTPQPEVPTRKPRNMRLVAVVIAVIVVAAGAAAYVVLFLQAPAPPVQPVPAFGVQVDLLQVQVDASSARGGQGTIATYEWDWGDGATSTGVTASHTYAAGGTFTVTLTVTDAGGRIAVGEKEVSVDESSTMSHYLSDFCQPTFDTFWFVRRGTYGDKVIRNEPPAVEEYPWGFDDPAIGNKDTSLYCLYRMHSHGVNVPDYDMRAPVFFPYMGRFDASALTKGPQDNTGSALSALGTDDGTAYVVGAGQTMWLDSFDTGTFTTERLWSATLEVRYWTDGPLPTTSCSNPAAPCIRWSLQGSANESVALRLRTASSASPLVDWITLSPARVNSWAPIGVLNVTFVNSEATTGVHIDSLRIVAWHESPGPASPQGSVDLAYTMNYGNAASQAAWASLGYIDTSGQDDGFITDWRGTLTMDYETSQLLFGVSGDPQAWWDRANAVALGQPQARTSSIESAWANWFEWNGNIKYDVYNGFEWFFQIFIFEFNATIVQQGGSNETVVQFALVSWGGETLLSRWFYWGPSFYVAEAGPDGFYGTTDDVPTNPAGWYGQELGWMERAWFNATFDSSFDYDWKAVLGYQMVAGADPGPDGQYRTADDEAIWTWQPQLMDYVQDPGHPRGEMRYYVDNDLSYVHTTPGSYVYGQEFQWDNTFVRWHLRDGETLILEFPSTPMIWFDPVGSRWDPAGEGGRGAPSYSTYFAELTLKRTDPASAGSWDEASKTISFVGPLQLPDDGNPALRGTPMVVLGPVR